MDSFLANGRSKHTEKNLSESLPPTFVSNSVDNKRINFK